MIGFRPIIIVGFLDSTGTLFTTPCTNPAVAHLFFRICGNAAIVTVELPSSSMSNPILSCKNTNIVTVSNAPRIGLANNISGKVSYSSDFSS